MSDWAVGDKALCVESGERDDLKRVSAMSDAFDEMARHARSGGPQYEQAKARFWRLKERG